MDDNTLLREEFETLLSRQRCCTASRRRLWIFLYERDPQSAVEALRQQENEECDIYRYLFFLLLSMFILLFVYIFRIYFQIIIVVAYIIVFCFVLVSVASRR